MSFSTNVSRGTLTTSIGIIADHRPQVLRDAAEMVRHMIRANSVPSDVRIDCQLINRLVHDCQLLVGRVPLVGATAVLGQFRALVQKTPNPRTVFGRAFMEHLVLQLALRLSPGLRGPHVVTVEEARSNKDQRQGGWGASDLIALLMRIAPSSAHGAPAGFVGVVAEPMSTKSPHAVDDAVAFIGTHFADARLRLAHVAAHVRLSASHLDRQLKKHSRTGFVGHLRRVRIQRALELLAQTGLSIKEIAAAVGYDRVSTFDRNFKHGCACSPGEWRRRVKAGHPAHQESITKSKIRERKSLDSPPSDV